MAQPLGQQARAHPGQPVEQIGEALRAGGEVADEQQRPSLADEVERVRQAAVLTVGATHTRHTTDSG